MLRVCNPVTIKKKKRLPVAFSPLKFQLPGKLAICTELLVPLRTAAHPLSPPQRRRLYYSIILRCHRSFNVSTGLDESSCPGRWSYPNFDVFLTSSSGTYRALDCLTQTCFYIYFRRISARTWRIKTDATAGGRGNSPWSRSRGTAFSWKAEPVHKLSTPTSYLDTLSVFPPPDLNDLVNDRTRQRLAHRASYAQGVRGGRGISVARRCPRNTPLVVHVGQC